jgi:hypothetical protein
VSVNITCLKQASKLHDWINTIFEEQIKNGKKSFKKVAMQMKNYY